VGAGLSAPARARPFLFETVGRPDVGFTLPEAHIFCDWLIRLESLVRTYAIDLEELRRFRQGILAALSGAQEMHVTSAGGTDITLHPRHWHATDGEVFTAPVEDGTHGDIWVDGCAYGGPPRAPFLLEVREGRVVNLDDLGEDEQQRWVHKDLTRDANARVLAELGIGIHPDAQWDQDLMESEQARGTCHFGFGHNRAFGGGNESSYHFDLVVRAPSIEVDGEAICTAGRYKNLDQC
jgi:leucyl aminopeptidase (aminopeptidase T)